MSLYVLSYLLTISDCLKVYCRLEDVRHFVITILRMKVAPVSDKHQPGLQRHCIVESYTTYIYSGTVLLFYCIRNFEKCPLNTLMNERLHDTPWLSF